MRQLSGDPNAVDEEIFALDVMLLMLSGSFDVAALVANQAYELAVEDHNVGWRRTRWRQKLRKADKTLADLAESGEPVRDALDAIALVRNTVHGEALRAEKHSGRGRCGHRVRIPDNRRGRARRDGASSRRARGLRPRRGRRAGDIL